MKIKTLGLFVLAAALFAAVARAQDNPAPAPAEGNPPTAGKMTKDQKKAAWEAGIKQDCAAEIGTGGVCAGKDFGSGLMECLHKNHKSLSDGCKVAVHKHHHGMMGKKATKGAESTQTPNAPAPTNPPSSGQPQ